MRVPKNRRLWINIKVRSEEPKPTRSEVREKLTAAINRGDYQYPEHWYVQIEWRNTETGRMKTGEFAAEMRLSKQSSIGFDKAVLKYLQG